MVTLYRPVGPQELGLIADSGWTRFPARLPQQPFFYPVKTFEYAEKIARDWNSTEEDSFFKGYVIRFEMPDEILKRWPWHLAGGYDHQELWVGADELDSFNALIVKGSLVVVARYENGSIIADGSAG